MPFNNFGRWDRNREKRRFLLENPPFKTRPELELPSIRGTINEPENFDLLRKRRKPLWGENYPAFKENPLAATPLKAKPEIEPSPSAGEQPGVYDYWKQPVIRGKGGKGGLPLDLGVALGGLLAHSIAPKEWSGRMGVGLANLGWQTYQNRMKNEQGEPELQRRLLRAQITKAEEPATPSEFQTYLKGGEEERNLIKAYKELGKAASYRYVEDENGNVSIFENGKLIEGSGKGKKTINGVGFHVTDDFGNITMFNKLGKVIGKAAGGKTKAGSRGRVPTSADVKQAWDIVGALNKTDESSSSDIALAKAAADKVGLELKKSTGKSARYGLPFWNKPLWGGKEITKWELVPKGQKSVAKRYTAINPETGVKIFSDDGKNWVDANGRKKQ